VESRLSTLFYKYDETVGKACFRTLLLTRLHPNGLSPLVTLRPRPSTIDTLWLTIGHVRQTASRCRDDPHGFAAAIRTGHDASLTVGNSEDDEWAGRRPAGPALAMGGCEPQG